MLSEDNLHLNFEWNFFLSFPESSGQLLIESLLLKMTITDYISDTVEGDLSNQSQTTVILQRGPDQSITDYSDAAEEGLTVRDSGSQFCR